MTTPVPEPGTLVLHVVRRCCYTEGAVFFLEVRKGVTLVVNRTFEESTFRFRVPLPPGRYTVLTYERPCPGACPPPDEEGPLDPPTSRCERMVEIEPGRPYRLNIITGPQIAGCVRQG